MLTYNEKSYFTVEEAAERLLCTPETIRRYIRQGKLKATKIIRRWYISEDELTAYVTGNETTEEG